MVGEKHEAELDNSSRVAELMDASGRTVNTALNTSSESFCFSSFGPVA